MKNKKTTECDCLKHRLYRNDPENVPAPDHPRYTRLPDMPACPAKFKAPPEPVEEPMGIDPWIAHGKKYGYLNYVLSQERERQKREMQCNLKCSNCDDILQQQI